MEEKVVLRYSTLNMSSAHRAAILSSFGISEHGLSEAEVKKRREEYGFNELPEKKQSLLLLLLEQFNDVTVYILLAAVAISVAVPYIEHGSFLKSELVDGLVILAIVVLNAALGFAQEWRAENSIAMLKKLSAPNVKVHRDGKTFEVPARELVPGDIMQIEAGDRVSADARVIRSSSLDIDESSLTGESLSVTKVTEVEIKQGVEGTQAGLLYSGTLVTRGSGEAVVTATGLRTELGGITSMMMSVKPPPTPLELELKSAGKRIGIGVLALCALIFGAGILKGIDPLEIFFTVVSLAVAAVPEGLPAIVTVCLALGVQRMVKKHALIRRLDAIETLGSITVICADKTGTMTENKMVVKDLWLFEHGEKELAYEIGASCNRAELPALGDPTEIALLIAAEEGKANRLSIEEEEMPFTSEEKYMVTIHEKAGKRVRYLKGAPEVLAGFVSKKEAEVALAQNEEFSKKGLRVLAVAEGERGKERLVGLIAMMDPPRAGVRDAIAHARRAGIRTIMITGDHPSTAVSIAGEVGIVTEGAIVGKQLDEMDEDQLRHALQTVSVFARVQPKHKVNILEALQKSGEVVAMSGDGVNDALALKRAHVGVAMGLKGTDVARESAAMVLTDDNYSTIVSAVAEGRRIYDNIRKFVHFLMRSNVGEVMIIAGAVLLSMPLPLLPLHILWINLVTDSFPALALAAEPAEEGIMNRAPRGKNQGLFSGELTLLVFTGLLNALLALGLFRLSLALYPNDLALARTLALTSTIVFQMLLALSTRTRGSVFRHSLFKNLWMLAAVSFSLILHAVLLLTPVGKIFSVTRIPVDLWIDFLGATLAAFLLFELMKWVMHHLQKSSK